MVSSLLILASFAWASCESRTSCRGIDCERKPENCSHGPVEIRKKWVCGKGPGERCGGYLDQRGKCGSGMYCDNCGICRGCSAQVLTRHKRLECNNRTCMGRPDHGFSALHH